MSSVDSDHAEREVTKVAPGDVVDVVDEQYQPHIGLVTAVHGQHSTTHPPLINVVYVSGDEGKTDPYGRQVERLSSLNHYRTIRSMDRPGRYWVNR